MNLCLFHIVEGKIASDDFVAGILPTLLPDDSIELIAEGETFAIKDASDLRANFVTFDLEASNGFIHSIDKILIPSQLCSVIAANTLEKIGCLRIIEW